ncbi:MAG TPA: helix-turn-helix domain-containing protein [Puia sp.]|nr:helix-turn-helix domain-containing protein [Puia sp.]
MEAQPYKVIKTITQYKEYCNLLEELVMVKKKNTQQQDSIELLTLLIEKWDEEHNTFSKAADPVELLSYLMKENKLKAIDLAGELEVSKSLISDILHYRRALSKDIIRKLADRFKVSQELLNKPYKLITPGKPPVKDTRMTPTRAPRKKLSKAL